MQSLFLQHEDLLFDTPLLNSLDRIGEVLFDVISQIFVSKVVLML